MLFPSFNVSPQCGKFILRVNIKFAGSPKIVVENNFRDDFAFRVILVSGLVNLDEPSVRLRIVDDTGIAAVGFLRSSLSSECDLQDPIIIE